MNIYSVPPLLAAIAYVPLLGILLANRPWDRQQRLFAWFLIAAILWSIGDILGRSDFLMSYKLLLLKSVLCTFTLAAVLFHCFVSSYYPANKGRWLPLAFASLAIIIFLVTLDYVPQELMIIDGKLYPVYGNSIFLVALPLSILTVRNLYFLRQRLNVSVDPVLRNQLVYLLLSIAILTASLMTTFLRWGNEIPVGHIGNLITAGILTYAVLRHSLLDMRFVFRRGLGWVSLGSIGIAVYLLLFYGFHLLFGFRIQTITLISGIIAAMALAAVIYTLRDLFIRGADRFFHRAKYDYRQKLHDFIQKEMSGILSLEEFSRKLLPLVTKGLDCPRTYLLLPDEVDGDFVVVFAEPEEVSVSQLSLKKDNPVLEWLKRENRYLSKENIDIMPEFQGIWAKEKEGLADLDIELLFPVVSRDKLIAILTLSKKKSGKYSLEDVNLLESVTSQVATSLEKEYLQEQLRKREEELALINRLSSVITSSLNIKEVYGAFIAELKQVVDVNWATIALIEGEGLRFEVLSTEIGSTWREGDRIPLEGTGAEWVAKKKKALLEPDLSKSSRFYTGQEHLRWGVRSIVYLPLVVKNEAIGSLIIASREPNAYTPGQVRLLERLALQIAVSVENSRLYARAEQRARIDELTGLFNRRHFDESVKLEIDRHARYRSMLSLVFLDLDFFKAYNDNQGHTAGDRILELVGRVLDGALRNTDLAFRYGGDEFAIILPQSAANEAFMVAERVRGRIAAEMSKKEINISASLGLASWPSDGVTSDELVNAADRALYYAKETGGNRTCVASKMLPALTASATTRTTSEKEVMSIIHTLAATIEARDPNTYGHSRKVSSYAVSLAEAIGLPSEKVAVISTAALLHDIGKIGIPDEVLNKVDKLEPEAWELIRDHPKLSTTIVGHVVSLVSCLPAILHHHERWDGNGYPSGLKGDEIPIEARVLAIADAFDAMTSSRPYRSKLSYKKVLQELKKCSGSQFDPELVDAFLPIALYAAPEESEVA
jgi:diguanylate cyclase (GGDEF)-like protein/putative nucleotidyltransferase with HDIG domain